MDTTTYIVRFIHLPQRKHQREENEERRIHLKTKLSGRIRNHPNSNESEWVFEEGTRRNGPVCELLRTMALVTTARHYSYIYAPTKHNYQYTLGTLFFHCYIIIIFCLNHISSVWCLFEPKSLVKPREFRIISLIINHEIGYYIYPFVLYKK